MSYLLIWVACVISVLVCIGAQTLPPLGPLPPLGAFDPSAGGTLSQAGAGGQLGGTGQFGSQMGGMFGRQMQPQPQQRSSFNPMFMMPFLGYDVNNPFLWMMMSGMGGNSGLFGGSGSGSSPFGNMFLPMMMMNNF